MADDGFPDTYTTKTTTTTTTTSTTVCTFNETYIRSTEGILRLLQIIVGLIYWIDLACIAGIGSGIGFTISVTIFAWVFTIIIFVLIVFLIYTKITFINWPLTEFLNNVIWAVLHAFGLLPVLINLFNKGWFGLWFGLFLGVGMVLLYGFHAFLAIRGGTVSFRSSGGGARDVET